MGQGEKIKVTIDKDLEAIVPQYLEWTANDIAAMREALEKGDFDTLKKLGHNLKGTGGGYGFSPVTEMGAAIEQLAKVKNGVEIRTLVEQLSDYFQNIDIVYE